ncbi:hypothetical protein E2320_022866, partial [Naja naja]
MVLALSSVQETELIFLPSSGLITRNLPQYVGLVQLLLYFQWNWVGLLSSESDNGEHFISTLTPMLRRRRSAWPSLKAYPCSPHKVKWFQLGVGFEFSAGDRIDFPSFLWINHKESPQYVGLVQLLLYFQWNWVGLLSSESDNGEHFISTLTPMLKEKEICLAFTERLKYNDFQITLNKL